MNRMNMTQQEVVKTELLITAVKETNPSQICLDAVLTLFRHLIGCIIRRNNLIIALTEELRGIEKALDDPRIHNTHTIEEVLREKLAGLNKFERI